MTSTLRLADLIGSRIVAADGTRRGHVVEIIVDRDDAFRITALEVGASAWLDRLHVLRAVGIFRSRDRDRIAWAEVDHFADLTVYLKPKHPDIDSNTSDQ